MTSTRLHNLDVIRGIAILGIPFMNIHIFALPEAAYVNPDWNHQAALSDKLIFSLQHLFIDGRFMTLFCLLFGAGMVLMWEKLQKEGLPANKLIQRRLNWLLLFGAIHGTFLWFGDILFVYALAGLFLMQTGFPTLQLGQLVKRGILFFACGQIFLLLIWLLYPFLPNDIVAELGAGFTLSDAQIAEDVSLWTGPLLPQLAAQLRLHILEGTLSSVMSYFWSIGGLMMIGAAIYKAAIFQKGFSVRWQWCLFVAGLLLSSLNLTTIWQDNFANPRVMYSVWNFIAALPIALFYISIIAKVSNASHLMIFRSVGRMAFTLYIFQSLVLVFMFRWGWPELYGKLDRLTLFSTALAFSAVQIVLANVWLRHFRQGPLEYLWRHLTYGSTLNVAENPCK